MHSVRHKCPPPYTIGGGVCLIISELDSAALESLGSLRALSLLCSLFLLAARHSANKFALCSRSAASVRVVRGWRNKHSGANKLALWRRR